MNREQLAYDLTDAGIIAMIAFCFSLMVVGFFTMVRTIVVWVIEDVQGRRFKRRARRLN